MITESCHQATADLAAIDGVKAWRMVAAAFTAGFVVFGVIYSFGVFLQPMLVEFQASRLETSAIYSIASVVWYMLGPVTGYLGDRLGPRIVVAAGAVAMSVGLVCTALIDQLWIAYLAYGLGVGLGAACAYVPTLAILGGWFNRKRNMAFGIAATGTGFGLLVLPWVSAILIEAIGWRQANLVLGVGSLILLAACALSVAPPPLAAEARSGGPLRPILWSAEFCMMYASWVLATTALFVPFVFLPQFAVSHGATLLAGSLLISILGAASILGRLGTGIFSKWMGSLTLFKLSVFVMGISHAIWLVTPQYGWMVVYVVILGMAYGLRIALVPSVLIELFGLNNLGVVLGVFFTATGFASLLGPMLAGLVVDISGHYESGALFAVVVGMLGFAAIAFLSRKTNKQY